MCLFRRCFEQRWMAGSSPAMTVGLAIRNAHGHGDIGLPPEANVEVGLQHVCFVRQAAAHNARDVIHARLECFREVECIDGYPLD
jgi:hypothetical protein